MKNQALHFDEFLSNFLTIFIIQGYPIYTLAEMADVDTYLPAFMTGIKQFVPGDTRNFNMYLFIFCKANIQLAWSGVGD